MIAIVIFATPNGREHARYVLRDESLRCTHWSIGRALLQAIETTRPAFREVADTLRWEDIR